MSFPQSHPLIELAKQAIHEYLDKRTIIQAPEAVLHSFSKPSGVFVSLKKSGQLRGCVGTFQPAQPTAADEVIHNAIAAATRDHRFSPLIPAELEGVDCSVDILSPPEPTTFRELDPRRFGVLVVQGVKRGLLLPDLNEIQTAEQQVRIAKEKAGILADDSVALYRFSVQRFR